MMLRGEQMENWKGSSCPESCSVIGVGEVTGELLSVWVAPGLLALLSQAVAHLRQAIDFIKGAEKNLAKGLTPSLVRTEF